MKILEPIRELIPEIDDDETWADYSLDLLAGLPAGSATDEAFRESIRSLVERIWVEDDGSITIEGVIPGIDPQRGRTSASPRSR